MIVDTAPNIIEKLRHREIEIGVISEKGFYDDDIKVKRFTDNPLMVAMDCHHPLAAQEHLTLTDITQYPFILHSGVLLDKVLKNGKQKILWIYQYVCKPIA